MIKQENILIQKQSSGRNLEFHFSSGTVPNGENKPNQDGLFISQTNNETIFYGIVDGHGVIGHYFTKWVIDFISKFMIDYQIAIVNDPFDTIQLLFSMCQENLRTSILESTDILYMLQPLQNSNSIFYKQSEDFIVIEDDIIFIQFETIHSREIIRFPVSSGCTLTLNIIIDDILYVSILGDSSSFFGKKDFAMQQLSVDSEMSFEESLRMKKYDTKIVYDQTNHCLGPDLFDENGIQNKLPKYCYIKNVREDIASLITTNIDGKKYSLAMSGSLGDFHLKALNRTPIIQKYSLIELIGNTDNSDNNTFFICASDGLWDNWIYKDLSSFIFNNSCIDDSCIDAQSLLIKNDEIATSNFGNKKDDSTAILIKCILT